MFAASRPSLRLRSVARFPATRALSSTSQLRAAFFPNEPAGPTVATAIPGPNNKKAVQELDEVFDARNVNMLADYQKSLGN